MESLTKKALTVGGSRSPANLAADNVVVTPKKKTDMDDLIESAAKLSFGETENRSEGLIPSKCHDSIWVWSKTSDQIYSRLDDELGGKWLIFLDEKTPDKEGLTILDKAWVRINEATLKGTLFQSKASTAIKEPHASSSDNKGVIVVYTKDFDDLEDVLKTAESIAEILKGLLPDKYALRYKTNAATEARLYPSQNCKNVTLYRYTERFGLQQREEELWVVPPSLRSRYAPPSARGRVYNAPQRGFGRGGRSRSRQVTSLKTLPNVAWDHFTI